MASRKAQKDAAREARLAAERDASARADQRRRMQMLGGVLAVAIVVIVGAIVISSSGSSTPKVIKSNSPQATRTAAQVASLLQGIPQQGNVLGSPSAKVTVTEYGDLVCPICKEFAFGAEQQLISSEVRSGKVKLVYRAMETASSFANNSMFVPSQVAARAAGQQKLGWNYIELFYHEQGDEDTSYVTNSFLEGLAKQITGLNFATWSADRSSSTLAADVQGDAEAAQNAGLQQSTPTIVVSGPKSQAQPIVGDTTFGALQKAITSVS